MNFSFQETFEKVSLSSNSSGAASLKSELSESADLAPEGFQAPCGKEEDRACDEVLSEDNFNLETIEKGTAGERVSCGQEYTFRSFLFPGSFAFLFLLMCRYIFRAG